MLRRCNFAVDPKRQLEALFAPGVRCAEAALVPCEAPAEQRQREFATGRALAQTLLGGIDPLAVAPHGAPRWPKGVLGTIAHSDTWCVVAVTRAATFAALGIDVEPVGTLASEVLDLIARSGERAWVHAGDLAVRGKQLFCAKESFFKCLPSALQEGIEHKDLVIEFAAEADGFRARSGGYVAQGRFGTIRGHVVATSWVGAS